MLPVSQLSTFQRADQRTEVATRVKALLVDTLTKDDASKAMRLLFNDAATYDVATKTGGIDGSVVLSAEEASRPENDGLGDLVDRLSAVKATVDGELAAKGAGPLSWADLLVLAAKTAVQKEWFALKVKRVGDKESADTVAKAFGSAWDVKLGRVDTATPAPAGRALSQNASTEEMRQFMLKLGAKPGDGGPFAPKPPFWERPAFVIYPAITDDPAATEARLAANNPTFAEFKKKYDQSRSTITRTDYEVDFVNYFTKLTSLGAKFDPDAYLYPVKGVKLQ